MSRRSQAFAFGQQAFSWKIEKILDTGGRERFKATCRNQPAVFAIEDTEQTAMRAAQKALEKAVDSADLGMLAPGQL